jgi:FAD/FMN-containing dehydrogenase
MDFELRHDVTSWGRVVRRPQLVARPAFRDQIGAALAAGSHGASYLATGLRRSYGDSCLNSDGRLIETTHLNRFMSFDPDAGALRAEAGASLADILALVVPHGWFLPTTPGTRFVTLGGAVANDVHGKNHHRAGTFGRHVRAIGLMRSDGDRLVLSPTEMPELFAATIGGLGLTGIIEWVEIGLVPIPSSRLNVETIPFRSLEAFWDIARASVDTHEHTVAWIDCVASGASLGRGVFSRANWQTHDDRAAHRAPGWKRVPFDAPAGLLNGWTIRALNEVYYRLQRRKTSVRAEHYAPFFYPLDAIADWNRLYGRPGMYQYQCVIPSPVQEVAVRALLGEIVAAGEASFLAVLKTFGALPSPGLLSFPREGATLALDFRNRGAPTLRLMERLDAIVRDAAGALYPAKDGRMSGALFRLGYPGWERFSSFVDPAVESDFWRRVRS